MLERKPLAGPSDAALHFVQHQQPAVGIAYFAQSMKVIGAADIDAALALNQLDHHGNDVTIALSYFPDRGEVVERHTNEPGYQRFKTRLHLAAAGRRQGRDGTAVKRLVHDDNRRHLDGFLMAI